MLGLGKEMLRKMMEVKERKAENIVVTVTKKKENRKCENKNETETKKTKYPQY